MGHRIPHTPPANKRPRPRRLVKPSPNGHPALRQPLATTCILVRLQTKTATIIIHSLSCPQNRTNYAASTVSHMKALANSAGTGFLTSHLLHK